MASQSSLRMQTNLRIVLGLQNLFEADGNARVSRLVPGEGYHRAAADAETRILANDPQQVRHRVEVATPLALTPVASEGVGGPLTDFRMLVSEALHDEATGFRIRLLIEKSKTIPPNAPIGIAETGANHRQDRTTGANQLRKRLDPTRSVDREQ